MHWQRTCNEYFFTVFIALHELLTRCNERRADVGWDPSWMQPMADGARPNTWRHWFIDMVPAKAVIMIAGKQIAKYSAEVGHTLTYELVWKPESRL